MISPSVEEVLTGAITDNDIEVDADSVAAADEASEKYDLKVVSELHIYSQYNEV